MDNAVYYKALDRNMKAIHGNGMKYELDVTYTIEEGSKLILYKSGFHYCDNIKNAMHRYYDIQNFRVFEVKPSGSILIDECCGTHCSSSITITRELSKEEILKYIEDNDLIHDKSWFVRTAVANQGYGLDKLVNDEDSDVRTAVAKQGYGLDKLVNDKHWLVRTAVAKQGYGLDILINDEHQCVREAVANQGYELDKLINDKDLFVRVAAANRR